MPPSRVTDHLTANLRRRRHHRGCRGAVTTRASCSIPTGCRAWLHHSGCRHGPARQNAFSSAAHRRVATARVPNSGRTLDVGRPNEFAGLVVNKRRPRFPQGIGRSTRRRDYSTLPSASRPWLRSQLPTTRSNSLATAEKSLAMMTSQEISRRASNTRNHLYPKPLHFQSQQSLPFDAVNRDTIVPEGRIVPTGVPPPTRLGGHSPPSCFRQNWPGGPASFHRVLYRVFTESATFFFLQRRCSGVSRFNNLSRFFGALGVLRRGRGSVVPPRRIRRSSPHHTGFWSRDWGKRPNIGPRGLLPPVDAAKRIK